MMRLFKSLPLLGGGAVLAAVLLIGIGTGNSGAAECMGDGPERITYTGRAGSSEMHQFDFCSDPTLFLFVGLSWDNGTKDLALRVTEPNGTQHFIDHPDGTSEGYAQAAPLPKGTWTIEVINMGPGSVKYRLNLGFAN